MTDFDELLENVDHIVKDMMIGYDPKSEAGRQRLDECEELLTEALGVVPFPPGKTSIALTVMDDHIEIGFK